MLAILKVVAVKKKRIRSRYVLQKATFTTTFTTMRKMCYCSNLGVSLQKLSKLKIATTSWLRRGHSTTTCTKFYPTYPSPPSSGQLWTFYVIPTLCNVTKRRLYTGPPLLVHVVIEWPLTAAARCSRANWFRRLTWFPISVMRVGSDTFGDPIFQNGSQN